jgi:superfamily II DNA/RNA helicase
MKSLIAHQLPKKSDRVVFCPLTELQRDAYERFLDSDIVDIVKHSADACDCRSGKKRGWCCYATLPGSNTKWQVLVFPVIAQLQKLSNHLALLIPSSNDPQDKQTRDLDFLQSMVPDRWADLYNHRDLLFNLSNPEFCGKWRVLKKLLRFWHGNGDKVLVFSHSVKLLKMLQHLFHNTSYNVSFLDGSLSYEDRQRVVDDFNSDPGQFVFLISTKAGGVGLNITSANKVVIFDPNWNPSYDLQAQDRAYRIGQMRDVEVFRLVSAGTVEEIVYARQIYKQQQANIGYNASLERRYFKGVQNQKGQKGEIFGLQNLLTFHSDEVVLRDIVNKTNVAEAKAGVGLIDVEMDDMGSHDPDSENSFMDADMSEDAALSQLVEKLIGDIEPDVASNESKAKKKMKSKGDVVAAILASAGVEYTHENSEVVGSSKVEARLSRCAEAASLDAGAGAEARLFADDDLDTALDRSFESDGRGGSRGSRKYTFHPPEDVMKRQFCTMAKMWGFKSATEFALVVESWTTEQRRNSLERFYRARRETLDREEREKAIKERKERGMRIEAERDRLAGEEEMKNHNDMAMKEALPAADLSGGPEPTNLHEHGEIKPMEMVLESDDDEDDQL